MRANSPSKTKRSRALSLDLLEFDVTPEEELALDPGVKLIAARFTAPTDS